MLVPGAAQICIDNSKIVSVKGTYELKEK